MDDSFRIAELVYGSPPPQPMPLTIGYLESVNTLPLAVDAVYTVSDPAARSSSTSSVSKADRNRPGAGS